MVPVFLLQGFQWLVASWGEVDCKEGAGTFGCLAAGRGALWDRPRNLGFGGRRDLGGQRACH